MIETPRRLSILLVDDDKYTCDAYCAIVGALGHTALAARGGREALDILRDRSVDMLISDLAMPGMDGLELIERVRGIGKIRQPYVLMVTSTPDAIAATQIKELDLRGVLQKPTDMRSIAAHVTVASQEADLVVLTGNVEWVRSRPAFFFSSGAPCPNELATRTASEALMLGANDVQIVRHEDVWAVAADHDWLTTGGPALEQFHRIVSFPEAGANSMRQEILVTAYAKAVATVARSSKVVITGSDEVWARAWDILAKLHHRQRVVVFVWGAP